MTAGENIASIALDMGSHPLYRAAYDQYTNALGIGAHDDFIYAARCAGEYAEAWELVHDKDFDTIEASAEVAVKILVYASHGNSVADEDTIKRLVDQVLTWRNR
jgi:hypothetical protein